MSKATKGCPATTLDVLSRWRRPRPEQYLYLKQAELIRTLWQPLVNFCRILSDLPYHNKASKQTCVLQKIPKIGNPCRLAALSPAASWTSAAAAGSVIFVCCVVLLGGRFRVHSQRNVHPHFCELNLALTGDFKSVCTLFWWNGGQDVWFSRCGDDTLGSLLLHPVVSQWSLR